MNARRVRDRRPGIVDDVCSGRFRLELGRHVASSLQKHLIGYARPMLRPESWTGLAGGSPVPVGTGAPGSRPRFVVERRRAERGVKSLFGGSKCAGRSVKRTLQPRQSHNGGAEPLMSRRRPCPASPGPGVSSSGPSGVRTAARVHSLVRNRRDPSAWPSSGKDQGYKPMVKVCPAKLRWACR